MTLEKALIKALEIASEAHLGQVDKGGRPYIFHPYSVMLRCETLKEKIVALLHDVLEDTKVTIDDLRKAGFSEEIIEAVISVTRRENESYMDFVRRCKQNPIGRNVKKHDLEHNMDMSRIKNPTEKDYKRIEKYQKAYKELCS